MKPNTNEQISMELAVSNLMDALDRSPRAAWPQTILMAFIAMRGLGHQEGFRAQGVMPDKNAPAQDLPPEKLTHEELLERQGMEYMRTIARRFGSIVASFPDLTPENLKLRVENITNPETGESIEKQIKITF